jgi:hypothetical protein
MKFKYTDQGFKLIAECKQDKQWLMENGFARALICNAAGSTTKEDYNEYVTRKLLIQLSLGNIYKFDIYESEPLNPEATNTAINTVYEKIYVDSECSKCGRPIRVQKASKDDVCWDCGVDNQ